MKDKISISTLTIIIFSIALILFRIITPTNNIISWDVFAYYLYLPAKLIYNNLSLTDQSWLTNLFDKYQPSATLYQAEILENGNWVLKCTFGLAILYFPFFLIGHLIALLSAYPADGLSLPYQYTMAAGGIIFAIIGLIYFRKILLDFFSERITTYVLIIVVIGTNYFQLTAFDGTLLTHNFLFTLYTMLIWFTIKWHKKPKIHTSMIIGALCGLITLIRPSEIVCLIIPLLWNIKNRPTFHEKISLIRENYGKVIIAIFTMIIIGIPQLIYWKIITGHLFYYSYTNPGEGFEFFWPYTIKFLFSFRKGWFIYTPVMIFAIIGFINLYRKRKELFPAIFIFFCLSLYIISSWSCWWYAGASFSSRSLVSAYTMLAIPLGFFIEDIFSKKKYKLVFGVIFLLLIILNIFQTWQFRNGIITRDRMTMKYYFAIFGKTYVTEEDEKLLLIDRGTETLEFFNNENEYSEKTLCNYTFDDIKDSGLICHKGDGAFKMDSLTPYSTGPDLCFKDITNKDHAWIRASVWMYIPENYKGELPLLVLTFSHNDKAYKYRAYEIPDEKLMPGQWNQLTADYLTPEVRSKNDKFKSYIWHRAKVNVYIDDFSIIIYEPK